MKINVKKLHVDAIVPQYQSHEAAGFDLHAIEECTLQPAQRLLVKTGLSLALPKGYELQIRPRSGLAYKSGITVLNAPGTVDSDYRGEIMVLLINHSHEDFIIRQGDRIAQGIVQAVIQADFALVDSLDETARGTSGFGSTGV